jgi:hypothetical protein
MSEEIKRSQLEYPLDLQSVSILKDFLERNFPAYLYRSIKQTLTIQSGATSFNILSNYMVLTGAAAVTIATIIGGYEGQKIILQFTDSNVTITDDSSGNLNTVNLSAAFTSTSNDILTLIYDGVSWREVSRSVN